MEGLKATLDALKDRLSGALTGQFAVIWLLWNWRVPMTVAFGDNDRIEALERLYPSGLLANLKDLALVPLCSTVAYVVLIPVVRGWYAEWMEKREVESRLRSQQYEDDVQAIRIYKDTLAGVIGRLKEQLDETSTYLKNVTQEFEMVKTALQAQIGPAPMLDNTLRSMTVRHEQIDACLAILKGDFSNQVGDIFQLVKDVDKQASIARRWMRPSLMARLFEARFRARRIQSAQSGQGASGQP